MIVWIGQPIIVLTDRHYALAAFFIAYRKLAVQELYLLIP